jgi:uncharacterized protein YecT (DUF1311 family)
MSRRIVRITALLAVLLPRLSDGRDAIGGEEQVALSATVPFLQLQEHAQVTLQPGAYVASLHATDRSQVFLNAGVRVAFLTASGNATITLNAGTDAGHVHTSGDAMVFIAGGTLASLTLMGKSQAHIRQMTIRGGTFAAPGVAISGDALVYAAEASVHLYATELDFYQGKLTGIWGTGEPFAFWMVERQETGGGNETFSVPQMFPRQVIVHDLVVASFDCAKAGTAVEKTICADRELARLDRQLARLYKQALTRAPETRELLAAQARWLRTRRNPCSTKTCLKTVYEQRIIALQRLLSPHTVPVPLITPEKANAICQEVLHLTNTGRLEQRLLRFSAAPDTVNRQWKTLPGTETLFVTGLLRVDYNRDGKKDRLAFIEGGGTCGNHDIVALDAVMQGRETPTLYLGFSDEESESDDNLRWAGWGRADHFLFVHGEPVVVTANFWHKPADVKLVSWFGEGQQRPLCAFTPAGHVQIRRVADRHPRLCKAIAAGRWQPLTWDGTLSEDGLRMLRAAGHHADGGSTALADLNTDGQPDLLARLEYASGAGCGSYRQWLVARAAEEHTGPPSALNQALQDFEGPMRHYNTPKTWHDMEVFTFEGKPYILGSSPQHVAGVYSVWNDRPQTWCGFEVLEQFTIARFYTPR